MKIQLPLVGTPPILNVSVKFSSPAHTYYHNISGYYTTGDIVDISVGGDRMNFPLKGNTTYIVTARARNLAGWGGYSHEKTFTTCQFTYQPYTIMS